MSKPKSLAALVGDLAVGELSEKGRILLVAYFMRQSGVTEFTAADLREAFRSAGLPPPGNLATRLPQLQAGKDARLLRMAPGRYSLSLYGVREVEAFIRGKPGTAAARSHLEGIVTRIGERSARRFLAEAIGCLDVSAPRATIVMTWLLAFDHFCEYIVRHELAEFNVALAKRKSAPVPRVVSRDDLAEFKESEVIEIARSAGIITKDVRKILDEKLGIRNSCAHPSDIEVRESKAIDVVEDLVDNVILKYPV